MWETEHTAMSKRPPAAYTLPTRNSRRRKPVSRSGLDRPEHAVAGVDRIVRGEFAGKGCHPSLGAAAVVSSSSIEGGNPSRVDDAGEVVGVDGHGS